MDEQTRKIGVLELWKLIEQLGNMLPFNEETGIIAKKTAEYEAIAPQGGSKPEQLKKEIITALTLIKNKIFQMRGYAGEVSQEFTALTTQGYTPKAFQKALGKIGNVQYYEASNYQKFIDDTIALTEGLINKTIEGDTKYIKTQLNPLRMRILILRHMIAKLIHPELI